MTIHNDFPLSKVLWYGVGPAARYFLECETTEDVFKALEFTKKNHIEKVFVCGLGSNLIFSDDYFDGAVIRIAQKRKGEEDQITREDGVIEAFAGEELDSLIQFSFANKLTGLEWAGGLPGTVGAAIRGNVGAFGKEIQDNFISAKVLELKEGSLDIVKISKENFDFSYRNSIVKANKNWIVLSAKFRLDQSDAKGVEQARQVYNDNIAYRALHHPMEYPTCGSVFKNIKDAGQVAKILSLWPDIHDQVIEKWHGKVAMGYIIKRLGFSEYQVGQMQISPKHCNFITNLGGAKATDVLTIIQDIKDKVSATFGFTPEVEVEIVQ